MINIVGSVLGWFLNIFRQNWLTKKKKKEKEEEKDDIRLNYILKEISDLNLYRKTGTSFQHETKWTSKIYQLGLGFLTKKHDDILPTIKEFGEKYKDSIPPGGARTGVVAKHKKFWEEADKLQTMIEEKIKGEGRRG